jgi:hypothetical protein
MHDIPRFAGTPARLLGGFVVSGACFSKKMHEDAPRESRRASRQPAEFSLIRRESSKNVTRAE